MERYICKECGRYCYTAATSLDNHTTKDKCPYENCQGSCIAAPWNDNSCEGVEQYESSCSDEQR